MVTAVTDYGKYGASCLAQRKEHPQVYALGRRDGLDGGPIVYVMPSFALAGATCPSYTGE
jgi:hypothetical protein